MRWEYLVLNTKVIKNRYAEMMNDLGQDGWELVAVDDGIAYFKRSVMSIYDDIND